MPPSVYTPYLSRYPICFVSVSLFCFHVNFTQKQEDSKAAHATPLSPVRPNQKTKAATCSVSVQPPSAAANLTNSSPTSHTGENLQRGFRSSLCQQLLIRIRRKQSCNPLSWERGREGEEGGRQEGARIPSSSALIKSTRARQKPPPPLPARHSGGRPPINHSPARGARQ